MWRLDHPMVPGSGPPAAYCSLRGWWGQEIQRTSSAFFKTWQSLGLYVFIQVPVLQQDRPYCLNPRQWHCMQSFHCSRSGTLAIHCWTSALTGSPLGFQWSGCSDNLSYGVAFSQTFVDEPERAKGLSAGRPLMNLHNNEAGRKVGARRLIIIAAWQLQMCHWPFLHLLSPGLAGYPAQHAGGM